MKALLQAKEAERRDYGPDLGPQHVLEVIEAIVADDFCEEADCRLAFHPEELGANERIAIEKLMPIYRIVHSNDARHSCHHVHAVWRKETENVLEDLRVAG